METLRFKCELLSDIILNNTPATQGEAQTLPFIPGSNFLGLVAKKLYTAEDERSFLIFHSGKVRFGDANPSVARLRGMKIPASIYYPKLTGIKAVSYVSHLIPNRKILQEKQLKQSREGFYAFHHGRAIEVKVEKSFAVKSAYDANKRRARDEQLFGYEALQKGSLFFFTVEVDEQAAPFRQDILEALCGRQYIGRSRSAQYGMVEISECSFDEPVSTNNKVDLGGACAVVYADSRLIFLDENGYPTFHPNAQALGFDDKQAQILWDKCQVRTFQYAPWNYKRKAPDADRCGFEKGSVFVVRTTQSNFHTQYVGSYRQEGFGRVLYNPEFLNGESATGKTDYIFVPPLQAAPRGEVAPVPKLNAQDRRLFLYLKQKAKRSYASDAVYQMVNDFVSDNSRWFVGESFASQWGSIRSLAMVSDNPETLCTQIEEYLNHGVAKENWDKKGRGKALLEFLNQAKKKENIPFQELVVNLASEMGKQSSKHNSNQHR